MLIDGCDYERCLGCAMFICWVFRIFLWLVLCYLHLFGFGVWFTRGWLSCCYYVMLCIVCLVGWLCLLVCVALCFVCFDCGGYCLLFVWLFVLVVICCCFFAWFCVFCFVISVDLCVMWGGYFVICLWFVDSVVVLWWLLMIVGLRLVVVWIFVRLFEVGYCLVISYVFVVELGCCLLVVMFVGACFDLDFDWFTW